MRAAAARTFCTAGISSAIRTAMMAMTTSSSINVKPCRLCIVVPPGGSSPRQSGTSSFPVQHYGKDPGTMQAPSCLSQSSSRGDLHRSLDRPAPGGKLSRPGPQANLDDLVPWRGTIAVDQGLLDRYPDGQLVAG